MGATNPGRNMWVGIGIQTTASTVASVISFLQPTEVGGFFEEYATIDSNRRLGTRFTTLPYVGTKQVPFSFTAEANPGDLGRILLAALGMEHSAPSVTSVVHNHQFRFAEELPYITVFGYLAGVADATATDQSIRIRGAKIGKMTIKGNIDDVVTVTVEGVGMTASACSTTTALFTSEMPFFCNSTLGTAIISIGSTISTPIAFEEARSFELTIDNGLMSDHRIHGSNSAIAVEEGSSNITGTMSVVFNPSSFIEVQNFRVGNMRAITLTLTASQTPYSLPTTFASLAIALDQVRYSGSTASFDPDVITVDLPFQAERRAASLPSTMYVSLYNNKSLPYSAAV
jgi:hypothetical protein